jgi:hypothetical protein
MRNYVGCLQKTRRTRRGVGCLRLIAGHEEQEWIRDVARILVLVTKGAPSNEAVQMNAMVVVVYLLGLRLCTIRGLTRRWVTVFGGGSWELACLMG